MSGISVTVGGIVFDQLYEVRECPSGEMRGFVLLPVGVLPGYLLSTRKRFQFVRVETLDVELFLHPVQVDRR